jgi:hypothetical protein
MRRATIVVAAVLGIVIVSAVAFAAPAWLKGSTEEQLKTLADIQPGLGTVMIEYGARYTNLYYAAKGGNWDLAAYQLKEAREIQEVGETTRPARAEGLKAFEKAYLDPIELAIKAKNFQRFNETFKKGVQGCNGCHAAQGFPYIRYELPKAPTFPLSFKP